MAIDLNDDRILVDYFGTNYKNDADMYIQVYEEKIALEVVYTNEDIVINGVKYTYYKTTNSKYKAVINKNNEILSVDYNIKRYYSLEKVNGEEKIIFWDYYVTSKEEVERYGYSFEDYLTVTFDEKTSEKIDVPLELINTIKRDDDNIIIKNEVFMFLKRDKIYNYSLKLYRDIEVENNIYYKRKNDDKIFGINIKIKESNIFKKNNWQLIECSKDIKI